MISTLFNFKLIAWFIILSISVFSIKSFNIFKNDIKNTEKYSIDNTFLINKLNKIHYISYKNNEEKKLWADDLIHSLKIYEDSEQVDLLIDSIEKFKNNISNNRLDVMISVVNVTSNSNFLYYKGESK